MRLEHIEKRVYEPIRTGGWEMRFTMTEWITNYTNGERIAYVNVVEYIT
jgi:hypothetical protein